METGISVVPPSRHSMRLQPEPPVVTESRPRSSSKSSESSKHESRPNHSPECESRPCRSPERESRPRRSPERESRPRRSPERESRPRRSSEDENIGEYFIICSPLYSILYAFLYKINASFLFLFLLTTFLIIYISDSSLRSSKGAYNSSCYEVNIR